MWPMRSAGGGCHGGRGVALAQELVEIDREAGRDLAGAVGVPDPRVGRAVGVALAAVALRVVVVDRLVDQVVAGARDVQAERLGVAIPVRQMGARGEHEGGVEQARGRGVVRAGVGPVLEVQQGDARDAEHDLAGVARELLEADHAAVEGGGAVEVAHRKPIGGDPQRRAVGDAELRRRMGRVHGCSPQGGAATITRPGPFAHLSSRPSVARAGTMEHDGPHERPGGAVFHGSRITAFGGFRDDRLSYAPHRPVAVQNDALL